MAEPVSIVAQVLGGARALGLTGAAIGLSSFEFILTLVEEGFLRLPGPTPFRSDIVGVKKMTMRRLEAITLIDEAHASQEEAVALQKQAEARRIVAEAVKIENQCTMSQAAGVLPAAYVVPVDVMQELRVALTELTESGGSITVDALEVRKALKERQAKRAASPPGQRPVGPPD